MATLTLRKDKFHVHKKSKSGKCPHDFVKIKGIDETVSPAINGEFPEDTGSMVGEIKLCGKLAQDYTFTHSKGKQLILDFSVNDSGNLKGFRADICLE